MQEELPSAGRSSWEPSTPNPAKLASTPLSCELPQLCPRFRVRIDELHARTPEHRSAISECPRFTNRETPRLEARPSHVPLSLCFCPPSRRLAPASTSSSVATLICFRPCRPTNSAKPRRRSRRRLKNAMRSCRGPPRCPQRSAPSSSAGCYGNSTPALYCESVGKSLGAGGGEKRPGRASLTFLTPTDVRPLPDHLSRLVVLYVLNYIDRSALSSARTKGFEQDLGITDQQMDTLLSIRESTSPRFGIHSHQRPYSDCLCHLGSLRRLHLAPDPLKHAHPVHRSAFDLHPGLCLRLGRYFDVDGCCQVFRSCPGRESFWPLSGGMVSKRTTLTQPRRPTPGSLASRRRRVQLLPWLAATPRQLVQEERAWKAGM